MWAAFLALVAGLLALDLGVFHRRPHEVRFREALAWSAVWVAVALLFNVWVAAHFGRERGLEFLTGYLIEKALSVDNVFVFLVLFSTFAVPAAHQHRVLFWGIIGAVIMRGLFVVAGAAALERFHGVLYVFAALLVFTGIKLLLQRDHAVHPERNPIFRLIRRIVPATAEYHGSKLFTRVNGRRLATPLFVVLVAVEATDVVFAVDSIPAIFAVTRDPFIVLTSNVFAIFGLRAMYFLLAGAIGRLRYLKVGLALVLVFVGIKMGLSDWVKIPIGAALGVTAGLIGGSIAWSLLAPGNGDAGREQAQGQRL